MKLGKQEDHRLFDLCIIRLLCFTGACYPARQMGLGLDAVIVSQKTLLTKRVSLYKSITARKTLDGRGLIPKLS